MTTTNIIRLASVRVVTGDLARSVDFYRTLTGATPNYLTDDFVELVTPSATLAITAPGRVPMLAGPAPRGDRCIVEFWVDDAAALFATLTSVYGDALDVVQPPTMMPWGNVSALIRDPDGQVVNLYTPVTESARQLQRSRTPGA